MNNLYKSYAPIVLRIGLCLVFLWFGVNQIAAPEAWVSWLPNYSKLIDLSPEKLIMLNGFSEVVLAMLVLIGVKVRIFAFLLAAHSLHVLTAVGYGHVGICDFAIFVSALSVSLQGADKWSLEYRHPGASEITI